jgi:flagellar M-ring protein FliF
VSDPLQQLRDFHAGLEPARRRTLWAAAAVSLAAIVGVGVWASQPDYVLLTRASDTDEAGVITRSLAQEGIPFHLDADGLTVRVPSQSEIDARKAASGDGGIVGLEGLDKIDPWVTPFQEQLHRQRMIQGELVRTIDTLAGVASSTVHLTLPEHSAFLRDQERSTAAVTLRPDPGAPLDRGTARSVAQLVSHAVTGMTAQDVTVVDASTGRVLWGDASDTGAGGTGTGDLAVAAAAREAALAEGVRSALAHLLGDPEAASVTVHVELETAAIQSTTNAVDPDSAVAATERVESEKDTRATTAAAGVPGTDSNIPERTPSASLPSGREHNTSQTTYQYTTTTTTTIRPAGDIRRLSASVLIDSAALTRAAGGDEAALRQRLDTAVRAALGASETRGDAVVLDVMPFATPTPVEVEPVAATVAWQPMLPSAVAALALVLVFVFFVRPLMRATRPATPAVANTPMPLATIGDDDEDEEELDLSARLRAHIGRLQSHQSHDISDLVRKESEHSAEVLRRWIRA